MGEKNVDESMEGKTADVGAAVKKAALKAMKKKPLPCGKKKKTNRVAIFSPWRKKMVSVEPYGATAKRLYRWYIQELDFDAGWIAPPDLKFHEASGRFTQPFPRPRAAPPQPPGPGASLRKLILTIWPPKTANSKSQFLDRKLLKDKVRNAFKN